MSRKTRRSLLKTGGALGLLASASATGGPLGGTVEASTETGTATTNDSLREVLSQLGPRRTLMAETRYENGVYVVEGRSPEDGPTAVVVAGQHGIEPAGWLTAMQLTGLTIERGRLVVVPFANPPAIVRGVYRTEDGDMNRHFPPGDRPTLPAAAAVWDELRRHDPDVVLDLHSSHGIYASGVDTGVGQAVFPTAAGRDAARSAIEWVNDEFLGPSARGDEYAFTIGNVQGDPDRPLLTHKVGHDLDVPGYLVEVTRQETALSERVTWETAMATRLLAENGLRPSA